MRALPLFEQMTRRNAVDVGNLIFRSLIERGL